MKHRVSALTIKLCAFLLLTLVPAMTKAQGSDTTETGISVSPSSIHFNAKPGATQTKTIKITNDTRSAKKFQVTMSDYGELDENGKTEGNVTADYKYALSKWLSVSPSYVEVPARESKVVTITIDVPNSDTAAIAAWTMLTIDQVKNTKKTLELPGDNKNAVGMGVSQGIGFGVYVYQNPPNVVNNKVEINTLKFNAAVNKSANQILMGVKNAGDGIGFCNYYLELTSLSSGKTEKLNVKRFTILPGYKRELKFNLPTYVQSGKYSAVAVLDFGSKDDLQTAELEFELK
jgi:hypothetical protein